MKSSKKNLIAIAVVILIIAVLGILSIYVDKIPSPSTYATFWALVPSVVAITLALITKEVYSSLFIGIVIGSVFASGFSFTGSISNVLQDGLIAQLSDSYNVGILIFLVILGTIVALMNKAGGSKAFGDWAATHIKTRQGAQLCTVLLGVLIFIDDYFNCLTVGSVMKPVTDKHRISRAKFAYVIDATAAPICIIAPVSSWAAAAQCLGKVFQPRLGSAGVHRVQNGGLFVQNDIGIIADPGGHRILALEQVDGGIVHAHTKDGFADFFHAHTVQTPFGFILCRELANISDNNSYCSTSSEISQGIMRGASAHQSSSPLSGRCAVTGLPGSVSSSSRVAAVF